jgi:broad specificity phosphatase PhoE
LLKEKKWTKVYSSDLGRALSTCEIIVSKSSEDHHIVQSRLLRECNFGVREGLPRPTTAAEARKIKAKMLNIEENEVVDTTESNHSIKARQQAFLKFLFHDLKETVQGRSHCEDPVQGITCAVVSHGGFIRLLLKNFCQLVTVQKIGNCATTILSISWLDDSDDEVFQIEVKENEVNIPCSASFCV